MTQYQLFATTPKAMEGILATEIEALGGKQVKQKMAGVAFQGDLAMGVFVVAYRQPRFSAVE